MTKKLWEGRFTEKTDAGVESFTSSIAVDRRLYAYDIQGSIAHCKMLAKTSIISQEEATKIINGLNQIQTEIGNGQFLFSDALEDIHMHIESRLAEIVGDAARKLHTARSRNDQIALDVRLYLRHESNRIIGMLKRLRKSIIELAKAHIDTVMPGYTHLQRAQPVLLAHHLMAYYEMFTRDAARFHDGLKRINIMPLGSAALAGTTYPIDRFYVAQLLNFPHVSENSLDAVSDRDFIIEFLSNASICMIHLSRWCEELVLWSSSEFSFIELPDAFATGSSIMPQKKNPDVPELIRGKTGRVVGDLVAVLMMMKSLPLAYNRDMQEDKPSLFDTVDTITACLEIFSEMLPKIRYRKDVMRQAASKGYLNATDLADYLATKGIPFREAHTYAGKAVAYAISVQKELHELTLSELQQFSPLISDDIFAYLTVDQMIKRRKTFGGTGTESVLHAIKLAEQYINNEN